MTGFCRLRCFELVAPHGFDPWCRFATFFAGRLANSGANVLSMCRLVSRGGGFNFCVARWFGPTMYDF